MQVLFASSSGFTSIDVIFSCDYLQKMPCRIHPTFTRQLFKEYDELAKEAGKSFLRQAGYTLVNEDEAYGSHDFIVEKDGIPKKVEVEVKNAWKEDLFPYQTHDVSCRKNTSKADIFIQVNARGTAIAMCDMSVVLGSPVYMKNCQMPDGRTTKNEPFYAVPISKMRYCYFEDNCWYED